MPKSRSVKLIGLPGDGLLPATLSAERESVSSETLFLQLLEDVQQDSVRFFQAILSREKERSLRNISPFS